MSLEDRQRLNSLSDKFLSENTDFSITELQDFNQLLQEWSLDTSDHAEFNHD